MNSNMRPKRKSIASCRLHGYVVGSGKKKPKMAHQQEGSEHIEISLDTSDFLVNDVRDQYVEMTPSSTQTQTLVENAKEQNPTVHTFQDGEMSNQILTENPNALNREKKSI